MNTIIIATTGEYSDYSVDGVFNILKPFTLAQCRAELLKNWVPPHEFQKTPGPGDLVNFMIRAGYVEVADSEEIHFGSYGEITIAEPERQWLPGSAPAQPDPLHVANERGEGEDAFPALHALTEAILTRADADFMQRRLTEAVRIMATHGWEPPVPFPAAPKEKP